jgi:hypothetical protein
VRAVAATTARIAEEACRRIVVDYEVLKPVLSLEEALARNAPILHEHARATGHEPLPVGPTNVASRREAGRGDLAAGFAAADVVVEREFRTPMVHQGYIEPHAVLARTGQDGRSVVWCCTQGPFRVRAYSAKVLGLDRHDQGHPHGDRRRLRRQDHDLRRAARDPALAQGRPAGEGRDVARGGVPRLGPDLGYTHPRQDGRDARRQADRRRGGALLRGGGVQGLAGRRRDDDGVRAIQARERAIEGWDV